MAKPVKVRTAAGEWADLAIQVPSANDPTFTGTTSSSQFNSTQSSGDEGGEIKFSKSATNTTLDTGVTLDVYQDKVRLFETGGTNRGGYFDMTTLGAGVSTNLAPGLTHINTTSFSAVSAVNINNCFSSTYQAYRINLVLNSPSADNFFRFRLRASGTDSTASYYGMKIQISTGGAVTGYGDANAASLGVMSMDSSISGNIYSSFMDVINPFSATQTTISMISTGININDDYRGYVGGNFHNATTSYDGFTLYPDAGTVSGTVRVYGYRNS